MPRLHVLQLEQRQNQVKQKSLFLPEITVLDENIFRMVKPFRSRAFLGEIHSWRRVTSELHPLDQLVLVPHQWLQQLLELIHQLVATAAVAVWELLHHIMVDHRHHQTITDVSAVVK